MELTNDFRVAMPVEQAWVVLTDLERIAPCMPGAQLQEVEGDLHRGVVKIKVGPITAQYKGQAVFVDRDDTTHVAVLRAEGRDTRGQGHASATITATLVSDGDGTAVSVVTDLTITGRVAQFGRGVLADVSAKLLDQFVESLEQMVDADGTDGSTAEVTAPVAKKAPAKKAAAKKPATKKPAADEAMITEVPTSSEPAVSGTSATSESAPPAEPPVEEQSAADSAEVEPATSAAPETTAAKRTPPDAPASSAPAGPAPSTTPAPAVRRIDSPEPQPVNLLDAAGSPVAKRVGPILAAVAILWLLKRLLARRKR